MNDQLVALGCDEHDDFEEFRSSIWTDDQPSVRILAEVVDNHRVFDRVEDVIVCGSMSASGRVDLYTEIL